MRWCWLALGFVLLLGADSGGCSPAPNIVGVQDYGSVTGRVLDATTNLPLANAIVSVGSLYTTSTDPKGAFTLPRVPVGQQQVIARVPGYTTVSADAMVVANQGVSIGYLRLVPIANTAGTPTLPPPPTPTPAPTTTPEPYFSPTPSSSPT